MFIDIVKYEPKGVVLWLQNYQHQGMLFSASLALARVVRARASHLWPTQNFTYVTVTFLHSNRKMHDNFLARQWTVYYWSLYRSHGLLYRPLYSVKTIDIVCRNLVSVELYFFVLLS